MQYHYDISWATGNPKEINVDNLDINQVATLERVTSSKANI